MRSLKLQRRAPTHLLAVGLARLELRERGALHGRAKPRTMYMPTGQRRDCVAASLLTSSLVSASISSSTSRSAVALSSGGEATTSFVASSSILSCSDSSERLCRSIASFVRAICPLSEPARAFAPCRAKNSLRRRPNPPPGEHGGRRGAAARGLLLPVRPISSWIEGRHDARRGVAVALDSPSAGSALLHLPSHPGGGDDVAALTPPVVDSCWRGTWLGWTRGTGGSGGSTFVVPQHVREGGPFRFVPFVPGTVNVQLQKINCATRVTRLAEHSKHW